MDSDFRPGGTPKGSELERKQKPSRPWGVALVLKLIELRMTHEEEFMQGRKNAHKLRDLWQGIAYSISSDAGFQLTGKEVREKWNNLRKEYLRQHSQVSKHGDDRVFWPFYWKMHEALGKVTSDETMASHGEVGSVSGGAMGVGQQSDDKAPSSTGIPLPTEAELPPYAPLDEQFMIPPVKRRKTATDVVIEAGLASDPSTQSSSYPHHHHHHQQQPHHHQSVFDLRLRLEEAIAQAIPAMKRLEGVITDAVDFLSRLPRSEEKNDTDISPERE